MGEMGGGLHHLSTRQRCLGTILQEPPPSEPTPAVLLTRYTPSITTPKQPAPLTLSLISSRSLPTTWGGEIKGRDA